MALYYPGKLEKIKITPEFKELLFEVELDKDILEIEGLYFYDTLSYRSTAPLYKYNPLDKGYSRLKYNSCPLFYLVGTDYLVYDITEKNKPIGLTTFNQSKPTEINHKYIILSEDEKNFKDIIEKSIKIAGEILPISDENDMLKIYEELVSNKGLEDYIDIYDINSFTRPVSKIWLTTKVMEFLKKFGYEDASYELSPYHLKIRFNEFLNK